jgi:hypothetical protein
MLTFADRFVDEHNGNASALSAAVVNAGLLLGVLLRGQVVCSLAGHGRRYQASRVVVKKFNVSCEWESDGLYAAVCSAVAELPPETVVQTLELSSVCRNRWLWVVYILCCGSPLLNLHNPLLIGASLTRADIAAIRTMMKNRYPAVVLETRVVCYPVYGSASIPEGAELQPTSGERRRHGSHRGYCFSMQSSVLSCQYSRLG